MERLNLAGDLTYISFISQFAFEKGPNSTLHFLQKKCRRKVGYSESTIKELSNSVSDLKYFLKTADLEAVGNFYPPPCKIRLNQKIL